MIFRNKSNLENFTLLKKFDSLVVGLIQPPLEIGVMFSWPGKRTDDSLCCLLLGLLSFDATVFWFLLFEIDANDIVGREGNVRVDLRSTLLLLEIKLGRLTMCACLELTPGTAGNFLIGRLVAWLRPRPPKIPVLCSFSVSRYCALIEGDELLEDPSFLLLFSLSFVLNVLPLWMPLSSVIVPWLDEEQELK